MKTHALLLCLLPLSILFVTGAARAQEAPGSSNGAGATATGPNAPPPERDKQETKEDYTHFRFGLGLDGNYLFASGINGAAVGLELRLGAQINQWFAVYYQGHGLVGGAAGGVRPRENICGGRLIVTDSV